MAAAAGPRIRTGDIRSLPELAEVASGCTLCRLCRDRTQVVTGSGDPDARVVMVVESPGYHEDREGRLLAGRPGEVFDELLATIGYTRDDVWLTSVVKCRPIAGRSAFPDEVEACEGWLFREIGLVEPRLVVTFGALALRLVTGRLEQLQQARGQLLTTVVQGRTVGVLPCYHPAAALHVPALLEVLRADVRSVPRHLRAIDAADTADAAAPAEPPAPGEPTPLVATPAIAPDDDDQLALPFA